MQLRNVSRIIVEDFPKETAETVGKLAEILNSFMDDVTLLSRKNISYDNLNKSQVFYEVTVDENGVPLNGNNVIKINLGGYTGKVIQDVVPLQNTSDRVISSPYLECQYQGNGFVRVSRVLGLPANRKFRVVLEFTR
jgi:hypothetical protein